MTDRSDEVRQRDRISLRTARMEAFSDGVFAIAITLLVLDLAVPVVTDENLLRALAEEWPSYLAYVASFSTIGAVWLSHTTLTEYLERADRSFMRINLALLLLVALLPFPTKLVAEYIGNENAERVAVTLYGLTVLVTSWLVSLLWRYSVVHQLVTDDVSHDDARVLARKLVPTAGSYLLFLLIGFAWPTVAVVGYMAIALSFMFPVMRLVPGSARRRERNNEKFNERRREREAKRARGGRAGRDQNA